MPDAKQQNTDTQSRRAMELEIAIRRRQVGLLGNALSHIETSPIAPESIRLAATAALLGAGELANELPERKVRVEAEGRA